jgi:hypothetical protein
VSHAGKASASTVARQKRLDMSGPHAGRPLVVDLFMEVEMAKVSGCTRAVLAQTSLSLLAEWRWRRSACQLLRHRRRHRALWVWLRGHRAERRQPRHGRHRHGSWERRGHRVARRGLGELRRLRCLMEGPSHAGIPVTMTASPWTLFAEMEMSPGYTPTASPPRCCHLGCHSWR